nr:MAG TPA: abortive infection protein [Caudoviricetes sp.]
MENNANSTLLILGNGFDLNLGLKTSYIDFMQSEYFDSLLKNGSNKFAIYLKSKARADARWVDIEEELKSYTKHVLSVYTEPNTHASEKIKFLKEDYRSLCIQLKSYLEQAQNEEINSNSLAKSLVERIYYKCLDSSVDIQIINFNYTNSVHRILDWHHDINYEKCVKHVHGSLRDEIVFGIEDSYPLDSRCVFLYKSYNKYANIEGLPQLLKKKKI